MCAMKFWELKLHSKFQSAGIILGVFINLRATLHYLQEVLNQD